MVTAKLTNYRGSPRKVRLVADLVRGKKVPDALNILNFTMKRATDPIAKLIQSAVANAKNTAGINSDDLMVREIRVDAGIVLKRSMPRARGSAFPIRKRSSHVFVSLAEAPEKKVKKVIK